MAINTSMSESSEECVTDTAQVFQIPSENQSGCEAEPSLELRTFLAYPASPVAAASVPAFVPPTGSASREWTYIEGVCAVEAYLAVSELGHYKRETLINKVNEVFEVKIREVMEKSPHIMSKAEGEWTIKNRAHGSKVHDFVAKSGQGLKWRYGNKINPSMRAICPGNNYP